MLGARVSFFDAKFHVVQPYVELTPIESAGDDEGEKEAPAEYTELIPTAGTNLLKDTVLRCALLGDITFEFRRGFATR